MDEKELADRFSRDVDALLDEKNQADGKVVSNEYEETLDLARELSTVDFSRASTIKNTLRNQLQGKLRKGNTMFNARRQNKTWRLASFALVTMLIMLFVGTGAMNVAAQGLVDLTQRILVGDFTWILRDDSYKNPSAKPTRTVTIEARGDLWFLHTSIGNFGGDGLPGHSLKVQQFGSMSEAQEVIQYKINQPSYLPAGYELQVVMVTPMDWVFQFYGPGDEGLVIAQLPVGVTEQGENHITSVGVGLLTDKQIETVTLNAQSAGWVDGFGLMWEKDGMSFTVGDPDLPLEEIMKIAESLK